VGGYLLIVAPQSDPGSIYQTHAAGILSSTTLSMFGWLLGVLSMLIIAASWPANMFGPGLSFGQVHRLAARLDKLLPRDAAPEVLAGGYEWL
jgi:hypothetical protein